MRWRYGGPRRFQASGLTQFFISTVTYMRNHKDTKTQRKSVPTIIDAGFLCVFVSLWFLVIRYGNYETQYLGSARS